MMTLARHPLQFEVIDLGDGPPPIPESRAPACETTRVLSVRLAGTEEAIGEFVVCIHGEDGSVIECPFEKRAGTWIPPATLELVAADGRSRAIASKRARGRAHVDFAVQRTGALLQDALAMDESHNPRSPWRERAQRWRVAVPRSRRGSVAVLDVDEIERLRAEGKKRKEIAEILHAHPQAIANCLQRARTRRLA